MCSAPAPKGAGAALAVVIGPDHQAVAARGQARASGRRDLHSARAPRHRACGAGGPRGDRPRRRRSAGRVRRYAADFGRDLRAVAGAVAERRRARRARLSRRRSHRLWPAAGRGRPAGGDPGAGRRQRRGTRDQALQCRRDGVRWPQGAGNHRKNRQCQCQGRVLSDRRRHHRSRPGTGGRRDRNQRG